MAKQPRIASSRLRELLDDLNRFGHDAETGGYNRIGYGAADMAARDWFEDLLRREGLTVSRDGAANIFGRYGPAEGPSILVGSHLDTVPQGGGFDGALGVAAGLECIRALKTAEIWPKTAVEVVAFAEEEGRFGGMLGSQALAGQVDPGWLHTASDAQGIRLADAMRQVGLNPDSVPTAARSPADIAAFLELHIEQGPVLESEGRAIGIVEAISGVCNLSVTFTGLANHSGTTPMNLRADAFAGLAEFAVTIPSLIEAVGGAQSRITIGKVELEPNFPHTIPGLAIFSIIIRDTDAAIQQKLREAVQQRLQTVASRHRLTVEIVEKSLLAPVRLDPELAERIAAIAERRGMAWRRMPSGAGHDAQTMQSRWPSALIFVPSRNGISHAPEEYTEWDDVVCGAELLLDTLTELAVQGDKF
ncbi:Zn-dependent hydrolase [Pseudohoeflea sp. DP4N28-3]|uniref:Zn-dependent hydrolase n=1 Tax=Pseudohoeflea coraliihabitans TaxID=2860393 RepID=A0ABS6WPN9_9HYPH|nr:Zn-dependent hydrolase [Pseudohoeflea sp. DP4N28-3]MBW3097927.1 Zn-dependent hydrolase [Pseudohoeflea sp. DP4N28-3]